MLTVLRNSWALLLGVMLLMLGNGIQGTLLGIRGKIEGFSPLEMSWVMSAYYAGFLGGSRLTPEMIRRVGHVRVFAALGSMVSAALILYPVTLDWIAWSAIRVIVGFCFSGIYITAESWLNSSSTNETRGQALSAYMIMQMIGVIASQALLNLRDPGGFDLFVISSILVSVAFTPILLSAGAAPSFERTQALSIPKLFRTSPLGCVGMFHKQALVLVNYADATLEDVKNTYSTVQNDVKQKFSILLEPEPVLYSEQGLIQSHTA